ncbi:SRPBCC family protein [Cellulosimicrobium protaetiae]|uniref:SRPBCC family protein n=1 Tax=Cellulosimicrobium protaetiae TaxID=2587808 RepID=A0A6M5U9A2_9MICO|nr:SRPBCC family protein [Cellulosimicrobium protaetiae]QJW35077.1 SRPBCC family protein [Cellulosimicrobium protaetiae]
MTTTPTGAGTLGIGTDGTFRIRFDRVLDHPVDRVWAALTDPEKLGVWMPGSRIDPRVGGEVRYDFGEEGSATGEVTSVRAPSASDPTAELEHTWRWEGLPVSAVTWHLEPSGSGTRLHLTHREVLREPATEFTIGWHVILDTLDRYADGRSWDDVWDGYDLLAAHYASA